MIKPPCISAAGPVAGVAVDHDPPTAHLAADVAACVAVDMDRPALHRMADEVDAGQIPFQINSLVGGIARYAEQLGQRRLSGFRGKSPDCSISASDFRGADRERLPRFRREPRFSRGISESVTLN